MSRASNQGRTVGRVKHGANRERPKMLIEGVYFVCFFFFLVIVVLYLKLVPVSESMHV